MFSVHQKVFFKKHTEKVAVNTVVGLLYKVLKNCLLQACDVFDVKMIQIWTFPAAPSTERVPSLAERVAYLRYSINLRLFNWRVPALVSIHVMYAIHSVIQCSQSSKQCVLSSKCFICSAPLKKQLRCLTQMRFALVKHSSLIVSKSAQL